MSAQPPPLTDVRVAIMKVARGLWAFIKDFPGALLAVLLLWMFNAFPALKPWEPPQENRAAISNVALAERNFLRQESDGAVVLVLLFDIETVGYDRKEIGIATLLLDPVTGERIGSAMRRHGRLFNLTRTERSIVWLDLPYPTFDDGDSGCVSVRVFAFELPDPTPTPASVPSTAPIPGITPTPLTGFLDETILAYADSAPFDPFAPQEPGSCPAQTAPATPAG